MATITRFQESTSWQAARDLTRQVYALTRKEAFKKDYALADQIRRAAVSAMANIAEGLSGRTNRQLSNALGIPRGSAAEVQSHLVVALDQGYVEPGEFEAAFQTSDRCSRLIRSFMDYLDRNPQPATRNPQRPHG